MQPDKTELNALYKTFHYAEKWIHFWKRESKSARIMDRYQCPCVFAICQSPWVNAIHPGQKTFLTWTVNYRKTEDKRRASIQLYVKDGDAKSSSLWNITTEWWSVAHRSVAPLNKIKNCKRWEDSSDQQPCMGGGGGGVWLSMRKRRTFDSAFEFLRTSYISMMNKDCMMWSQSNDCHEDSTF